MRKEFKQTRILVKEILETEPSTRNSDMDLYIKVVEKLNYDALHKPLFSKICLLNSVLCVEENSD